MSDEPGPGHWTLVVDCTITRRKRWFMLYNPEGNFEMGSQWLGECLDFIADNDIAAYRMKTAGHLYEIQQRRIAKRKRT